MDRQGGQDRTASPGIPDSNMDRQDVQDNNLKHGNITEAIIGCAFEVIHELGAGFLESVYEKALVFALREKGLSATPQHPVNVMFRNECVGEFYADVLVEERVILELKAVKAIAPEHQAQVINYLNATGLEVGLLINFGNPKLEYKRFTRSKEFNRRPSLNMDRQDVQDTDPKVPLTGRLDSR